MPYGIEELLTKTTHAVIATLGPEDHNLHYVPLTEPCNMTSSVGRSGCGFIAMCFNQISHNQKLYSDKIIYYTYCDDI